TGGNLTCGADTNCLACESSASDGGLPRQRCEYRWFTSVNDLLRHGSCARFEYSTYDQLRCLCDTQDNCAEKLMSEQVW
ncbi:hypothetical protein PMAYCL1PPCAC_27331, partial [Pristionchus mayeri]